MKIVNLQNQVSMKIVAFISFCKTKHELGKRKLSIFMLATILSLFIYLLKYKGRNCTTYLWNCDCNFYFIM